MILTSRTNQPKWHLNSIPFSVQLEALARCNGRNHYGYFMEMGLGKTAVANNEYIDLLIKNQVEQMVVIAPNTMKMAWQEDAEKYGSKVPYYIWPKVPPDVKKLKDNATIAVNYEALITRNGFDYIESVMKKRKTFLVIDESIRMKNPSSARTRAIFSLKPVAPYRRLLSGKPMVQGPHDLWAQLTMLEAFPSFRYHPFKYTYCQMGGFMGKQIIGAKNEDKLHKIIDAHGFRALKKDWLADIPDKLYSKRVIEMTKEQKKAYTEVWDEFYTVVQSQEITINMVLTQLLRLQQIASGFVKTDEGNIVEISSHNPKLEAVKDIVENEVNGKVVIMCMYNPSFHKLVEAFPGCAIIKGGMKPEEIEDNKRRFNTTKECNQLISQIQAGKYGHTLLGSDEVGRCATIIYYENTFSLDDRAQSEDRIHRAGQTLSTLFIDFICAPIDSQVIGALQRKEDIASAVLDGIHKK